MNGGCLCGAVRYRIEGRLGRACHCHCVHCRRASGAAFVTWVEVERAAFVVESGEPVAYESRPGVLRRFCGRCGTQLTWESAEIPGTCDVTACSLDDPAVVTPEDHLWCDRRIAWLKLADGLPQFALRRTKG